MLEKLKGKADGVIVGSLFANGFSYTIDELKEIMNYTIANRMGFYVMIDTFIAEGELSLLESYMKQISDWGVDGVFFHDLSVLMVGKKCHMLEKLIYDGQSVLCNTLEAAYYLSKGIDCCIIARELTFEEIMTIVKNNKGKIGLQAFGHIRLSYSKRRFLTNYFKEVKKDYVFMGKESLTLQEEQRKYRMPIVEDEFGTKIYSDFIVEMYEELPDLARYLKRIYIDTLFVDDDLALRVVEDYRKISKDNKTDFKNRLYRDYGNRFSTGYLYVKTNVTKDEQEER